MLREKVQKAKRIVIKIGTNSIMNAPTKIDYKKIDRLAYAVSALHQEGKEVAIVTSGAVGLGASTMNLKEYPDSIAGQQALASIGQGVLMNLYSKFFSHYNQHVGQVLITRDVISFPESYKNVSVALDTLLSKGVIPIINENDAVSVDELNHNTKFGDNDTLSAIVSEVIDADLLVILSDIEGLYTANPATDKNAELITYVNEVTPEIIEMAGGAGSKFATGGMATKLQAADRMIRRQKAMVIMKSDEPSKLFNLLAGEEIGTLFMKEGIHSDKQYSSIGNRS